MNHVKYFCIQCTSIAVVLLTVFYSDSYISKPFTFIDLIAIPIAITMIILVVTLYNKFKKSLEPILLSNKILLSVVAIFTAIIFVGFVTGELPF